MKKSIFALILIMASVSAFSQDTKNLVYDTNAEVRKVGSFKSVDISNAITLYLSQGTELAVAISVENGDKDKVRTEVKNGVLKIYYESENHFWGMHFGRDIRVKAYVTIGDVEKIVSSGASQVRIVDKISATDLKVIVSGASSLKGEIKANNLKLDLTGASSFIATLNCNSLRVGISGASSANIKGTTDLLDVDATGASNLKAFDLAANTCNADASGASTIRVNVIKEFNKVQASGASSIHYRGEAAIKNFEVSGASSVKRDQTK